MNNKKCLKVFIILILVLCVPFISYANDIIRTHGTGEIQNTGLNKAYTYEGHLEASDHRNEPFDLSSHFYHYYNFGPKKGDIIFKGFDAELSGDVNWIGGGETTKYRSLAKGVFNHFIDTIVKGLGYPTMSGDNIYQDNIDELLEYGTYAFIKLKFKIPPKINDLERSQSSLKAYWDGGVYDVGTIKNVFHRPGLELQIKAKNLSTGEEGEDIFINRGDDIRLMFRVINHFSGRATDLTINYEVSGAVSAPIESVFGGRGVSIAGNNPGYNALQSTLPSDYTYTYDVVATDAGNINVTADLHSYYDGTGVENTQNWLYKEGGDTDAKLFRVFQKGVDIKVQKAGFREGDIINYVADIDNIGDTGATNITIIDDYDENLLELLDVPEEHIIDGRIVYDIPVFGSGEGASIIYTARILKDIPDGTEIINTITVSSNEPDSDLSNNTAVFIINK